MTTLIEVKTALEGFIKGRITQAELEQRTRDYASGPQADPNMATRLLNKALEAGLPRDVHSVLAGIVTPESAGAVETDPDRTVLAPEERGDTDERDPDATVVDADAASIDRDVTVMETDVTLMEPDVPTEMGLGLAAEKPAAGSPREPAQPAPYTTDGGSGKDDVTQMSDDMTGFAEPDDVTALYDDATRTGMDSDRDHAGGAERTVLQGAEAEPLDLMDAGAIDAAASSRAERDTGASWPTDTTWEGAGSGGPRKSIGPGTVLKDRFELLSPLGEGGMGVVYKAIDKLKVEAKDRNPYLAIKLLTGDFQTHPEAFIALQRESSKAQRLAHPNIATVYDFDRDRGTIYMTMELLEGDALNHFIRKKIPPGGLPPDEAMGLIEQLGAGLAYAHGHNLVHSDLKPGNCWLTTDGNLKLLDFGIARASKTRADESGETTVFDPGDLGALTPAYATVEMFEGQDPDPRDDIYAMACIAYELFTGKHPYNKVAAPKALEKGLKPAPVAKLTKSQNKGLMHGLALKREARTATVEQFLEEVRPKKSHTKQIVFGSIAAILLLGLFGYQPVKTFFEDRRNAEIVATLNQGDEEVIQGTLPTLKNLDERSRRIILDEAKNKIIAMYEARAERHVDFSRGKYDFPGALAELQSAKDWYPDSAKILTAEADINSRRKRLLNELTERFNTALDKGLLTPIKDQDDITDILAIARKAAPEHPLLQDERLPVRYAEEAQSYIASKAYTRAEELLKTGLAYAPKDSALESLRFQVKQELKRIQDEKLVAEIQARLREKQVSLKALPDFLKVRDDMIKLAELAPASPILQGLQAALNKAFGVELDRAMQASAWTESEKLLLGFARLLELPYLLEKRRLLSQSEQQAGFMPSLSDQQKDLMEKRKTGIDGLLASPEISDRWETALLLGYKDLIAMLPAGDPWLSTTRDRIAQTYMQQARQMTSSNRFTEAVAMLQKGRRYAPELPAFDKERQAVADAEASFKKQQAEKARLARIKGLKQTLLTQAEADKVNDARRSYDALSKELPADAPFLKKEGAEAIASAYLRLAQGQAEQNRYESALKLANAGLELAPDMKPLRVVQQQYASEVGITSLKRTLSTAKRLDVGGTRKDLTQIKGAFPDRYPALEEDFARTLEKRIRSLEKTNVGQANELLASARQVFPGDQALARVKLKLPPKPSKYAAQGNQLVKQGKLTAAGGLLKTALKAEPGHPEVLRFQANLEQKQNQAEALYQQAQRAFQLKRNTTGKAYLQQALALWSDNPRFKTQTTVTIKGPARRGECTAKLAGYGTRSRGTCYDYVQEKQKGPVMVVVPAGGGLSSPYAIGKYEVSVGDYNNYCRLSGNCQGITGRSVDLPITGISIEQAKAYAKWLSEKTGHSYHLPTDAQWTYAATAKGPPKSKDFNCRVEQGGTIIKGHALLNVKAGKQNGWGLTNFVGNAQEWVLQGGAVNVRGGSFEDSLSKCDISLNKPHSGNADETTGFRLVMDLG